MAPGMTDLQRVALYTPARRHRRSPNAPPRQRKLRGFCLTELFIVCVILGILYAAALAHYRDYWLHAQIMAETATMLPAFTSAIDEYYSFFGEWPDMNDATFREEVLSYDPESFAISGTIAAGSVTFFWRPASPFELAGRRLTYRAAVPSTAGPSGSVLWLCGMERAPRSFTAQGRNQTDVPARLLDSRCR